MSHHRSWVISTAALLIEKLSFLNCLFYVMPKIHPGRDHGQRGQCQCVFAGVHVQCFPYHCHITIEYRGFSESTSHPCMFPLLQLRLVFILG